MKNLGILGGMSWESTLEYYRLINQEVHRRLGNLHSAPILMNSVDFAPLATLMHNHDWKTIGSILGGHARNLEAAGAQGLILTTNTMHKVYDRISQDLTIPFLHIALPVAQAFRTRDLKTAGLLGTSFTMEDGFLRSKLESEGIDVLIPEEAQRREIHRIIFEELVQGILQKSSREYFRKVIYDLAEKGAQGIVLGCTEIGLLVQQEDCPVYMADTTVLHAGAAVDWMLDT